MNPGIQPYRIFVIENPELQKELGSDSFNGQIAEASHLIVFASFRSLTVEYIETYLQFMADERGMPVENLADYKVALVGGLLSRTDEENASWSARQAYIGIGTGLIAAANLQVDTTPMEGFNIEKFDEILKLKEKGLTSVVLLALGYRDAENDYMANLKKVRLPLDEFAIKIK
jgi:nitroreductase/dihydropteridine reductase